MQGLLQCIEDRAIVASLVRATMARVPVFSSSAFIFSAMLVGMPARLPLSTAAFLIHSFRVWGVQPTFAEIDMIDCQRDPC